MKVTTTYPHKKIKLTQVTEYTPDEKAFFIEECEGREVWATVEGVYQRTIEIKDYEKNLTNECKTIKSSNNGVAIPNIPKRR